MISHIQANELLDLYGELLTQRQLQILQLYYQEDYSLSEIQEQLSISRAAVSDCLRKGMKKLIDYENHLHLLAMMKKLSEFAKRHPQFQAEIEQIIQEGFQEQISSG